MNGVATLKTSTQIATAEQNAAIRSALKNSLYPGASDASIDMVLAYCTAASLDPMTKPVHIVPMWDSKAKTMRDVVMPGIGLYRTQAARTGECAGVSEVEFGPEVTRTIGGVEITFPEWARVMVGRTLSNGQTAQFTAKELWIENYAVKGGPEKLIAPNAMWMKRPFGQLAKCAEAQALRKAFPEFGSAPTAEEMEGKSIIEGEATPVTDRVRMPQTKTAAAQEQAPAAEATAESGIFVTENMKKMLLTKGAQAGLNEEELIAKFGRIDTHNINETLAALRETAEAQQ